MVTNLFEPGAVLDFTIKTVTRVIREEWEPFSTLLEMKRILVPTICDDLMLDAQGYRVEIHSSQTAPETLSQYGEAVNLCFLVAQERLRLKQEILSREQRLLEASHELRNPIAALRLSLDIASRDLPVAVNATHPGLIVRMRRILDRADFLASDFMHYARYCGLRERAAPARPTELGTFLDQLTDEFFPIFSEKNVQFSLTRDFDPGVKVGIEENELYIVLSNLLGNAIKFTPREGRIELGVKATHEGFLFRVDDSGPGIPAENIADVFTPYWQAPLSRQKGVGAGLSIARAVLERSGGRIWAEPQTESGASFRFIIPRGLDSKI